MSQLNQNGFKILGAISYLNISTLEGHCAKFKTLFTEWKIGPLNSATTVNATILRHILLKVVVEIYLGEFFKHLLEIGIQSLHVNPKYSSLTFTSNEVLIKFKDHLRMGLCIL